MDRNEFMELVYETFAEEPDNVLANGIIEAADAYVEYEKAQLLMQGTTKDATSDTIQSEPQEGHWIPHESPDGGEQYECSECGVLWEFNDGTPEDNEAYFCPKCGARMKGERQK